MRTNLQKSPQPEPGSEAANNNREYRRRFRHRNRRERFERPPWIEVSEPTLSENEEHDGLELRFPGKPGDALLNELKGAGWRWSSFSGCWYAKRNDNNRAFAEKIINSTKAVDLGAGI